GDMGYVQPAEMQVAGTDLLQTGHVLQFRFTEAAEVDFRYLRDAGTTGCGCAAGSLTLPHDALDEALHILLEDTIARAATRYVGQLYTKLPGQLAYGPAGMDLLLATAGRADRGRCGLLGGLIWCAFFLGWCCCDFVPGLLGGGC